MASPAASRPMPTGRTATGPPDLATIGPPRAAWQRCSGGPWDRTAWLHGAWPKAASAMGAGLDGTWPKAATARGAGLDTTWLEPGDSSTYRLIGVKDDNRSGG